MKKYLLIVAALLGAGRVSAADPTTYARPGIFPEPAQLVTSVKSSETISGLSISSASSTSVIQDITQMYRSVCVQNIDTTSALYCGENVLVSSITTNALIGVVIAPAATATTPAAPVCFSIVPGYNFYCRTGSVTATTRAVIVRAR